MPNSSVAYYDIAYGSGARKFVCVGNNGEVPYSTDGSTWKANTLSIPINCRRENENAANGGLFVIVGTTPSGSTINKAYSYDGVNWTVGSLPVTVLFIMSLLLHHTKCLDNKFRLNFNK